MSKPTIPTDIIASPVITHVYLDDIRPCPVGWVLAKDYDECIYLLKLGTVRYLSLDHDLADEHYSSTGYCDSKQYIEKTGYDVCRWLVENPNIFAGLVTITLHSANVPGRNNMRQLLTRYKPDHVEILG